MALERLQALALVWVPQNDLVVTPAARENLAVERKGDRPDPITAIFSNVREHICNGRLRLSPLNLRLSPGERGRAATFRKMQSPVALERLQALACDRVPELERPVPARTGDQPVNRPRHSKDHIAAILLTCQFNCSTSLPR